jgi:hypothetical protein
MSWLFSQALVEEYLGANCLAGEQSALSSGSHTQQAYCAPDKMTDFSKVSRSGMTFKPLMESLGEELLTSYLAVFHAKISLPQEKGQGLTESDQECGNKWQESFAKYNQNMSMWKTPQCLLGEESEQFLGTWPRWGSMRNGECFQQPKLGQNIEGKGSGLWPTPTTPSGGGEFRGIRCIQKRIEEWNSHSSFDQPEPIRMVDGVAARVDRLKAIGNGQVPLCAATAWRLLKERLDGYEQRGMEKHL